MFLLTVLGCHAGGKGGGVCTDGKKYWLTRNAKIFGILGIVSLLLFFISLSIVITIGIVVALSHS